jgi:hypothetical protein
MADVAISRREPNGWQAGEHHRGRRACDTFSFSFHFLLSHWHVTSRKAQDDAVSPISIKSASERETKVREEGDNSIITKNAYFINLSTAHPTFNPLKSP